MDQSQSSELDKHTGHISGDLETVLKGIVKINAARDQLRERVNAAFDCIEQSPHAAQIFVRRKNFGHTPK
ncbi:MAG: hypothetical protein H6868_04900 [Rhodospirillales bacterium]|nr:hypothetical protein [Rhodospirillales bacterium]